MLIEAICTDGYIPNESEKDCYDCRHCKAAVGWWCTNENAVKWRGTSFPGQQNCKDWEPCRSKSDLSFVEKYFSLNFIYIDGRKS